MSLVSVVLPSYNHAGFVAEAIRSVLSQTYANIELIIVDDASTDGSRDIIDGFADQRIRRHYLPTNVGGSAALNHGIRQATGDFIAVCNSDDAWHPQKLEKQVPLLLENPSVGAVFSDVDWIDGEGRPLGKGFGWLTGSFTHPNRSSGQWIRRLLEEGNCLCHPSIVIRREIYGELGLYNVWLRQLPDLEMWLRLLQRHSIFVMADRLVRFRWHDTNTSRPSLSTMRRSINEHRLVARYFFEHVGEEAYYAAFGRLSDPSAGGDEVLQWEKAMYLMEYTGAYDRLYPQMGWEFAAEMLLGGGSPPPFVMERLDVSGFQQRLATSTPWLAPMTEALPAPLQGWINPARRVFRAAASRLRRFIR